MKLHKVIFIMCIITTLLLFFKGIELINYDIKNQDEKSPNKNNNSVIKYDSTKNSSNSSNYINVVLLGLDEDEVRSDSIVFLNFNKENSKLNIMSIPRDTKVKKAGGYGKINSLIGIGGEELTCRKIEEIMGLPVNFYISLNYKGFRNIIDILGGIEIDIKTNMHYDDATQNLHIHFRKGKALLDGKKAEQYVRYRKGNKPGKGYTYGDLDRMKIQQEFIISVIQQKAKLRYIQKLDEIFLVLSENMKTNIEIKDLNLFINGLKNLNSNEIKIYSLPGGSAYLNNIWYFINYKNETKRLIDTEFFK
jgi:polyisoprenyl-teichoic acid--peptidoglycan teichoic acid transferase